MIDNISPKTVREPNASPFALLGVLYRHRAKALLAFLLVGAAAVAAGIFLPRKYASEAKLFVRVGRESVALDPSITTNHVMNLSESRDFEINSIVEILRSRPILEHAVAKIGAEVILNREYVSAELAREKAIEKLRKTTWAEAARRSSVMNIHTEARSPHLAQDITQAILDSYLEEHVRLNRTQGTLQFFVEQATNAEQRVIKAKAEFRDAKDAVGLTSIEGQRHLLQTQLGSIHQQLLTTESSLAAAEAKTSELRSKMGDQPERVVDDEVSGISNPARDGMRQKVQELQIKQQELATKYTDDHPQLVALRDQLKEAEGALEREPNQRVQTTGKLNRIRESLELALRSEEANLVGLRYQAEELKSQLKESQVELRSLNAAEGRLAELEREVLLADTNYKTYADKREQARINQELDAERISNVNVMQAPTLETEPVFPQLALVVVLGLISAVGAAFGVALLAEFSDHTLHTSLETEQQLQLPVLVSIPRMAARETLVPH